MFLRCFFNTLDTTTEFLSDGTTYVFTGDIPAMWLRDSSVQVSGYLPYAKEDGDVNALIRGLLKRQYRFIVMDPYANAFNAVSHPDRHIDETDYLNENVWERKYEIDSLCYPLWLTLKYHECCQDDSVFDEEFFKAYNLILDVFIREQHHDTKSSYYFRRKGHWALDSLQNDGKGGKTKYTGMIWSAFRPSDDKCRYHYLVPSNQMAVAVLSKILPILKKLSAQETAIQKTEKLIFEIKEGIRNYGLVDHPKFGKIYAYETDGLGNYNLMDDANVPSLLSLPYLGYCGIEDEIYQNTRNFILSKENPFYFEGTCAKGVGSPHTPSDYVWHISLVIQLLTAKTQTEKDECFNTLISTDGGTGFMHESFDVNNPQNYTRDWFAWANTLFAQAVIDIYEQ